MRLKNLLFLILPLIIAAALLPGPAPANAGEPIQVSALHPAAAGTTGYGFEIGPVVVQQRIAQGEQLHLIGAVRLSHVLDVGPHFGLRSHVTQSFTEGRLRRFQPGLETGFVLRF